MTCTLSKIMKLSVFAFATVAIAGAAASRPGSSLRYEHPGRVFSKSHSHGCCVQGVVHDEEPRGHLEEYDNGTPLKSNVVFVLATRY